ncbi:peptide chain release factor N(5)-glutamine methyltransferase [Sedimenticola thiotaurini]|uniref:Release factor glutamine methyltransferase n=1 Tax=Sedimenticola thiotaurini TaxID=1543721 RepID=A0A0F7K346_9GAMM|nr:peptide chain release factor N(5)-glutamine methyltransferase [Sedimenticola thiotaurini]AKH21348.1 SAM-dependent methyltransferase [Sedimenticola thiotaurini]
MSDQEPLTITTALRLAEQVARLTPVDAQVLLCHVLHCSRSHLYAWPEQRLSAQQANQFHALLDRRAQGEPIAYLTGYREFWSLNLRVTPDTLIPRPETELLVECALTLLEPERNGRVADLGTGSGAIAAAIASECPRAQLVATDISGAALAVARENVQAHRLHNIELRQGSWLDALKPSERFDLILSNPPYVAENDPHLEQNGLPWEPQRALTAGADGLADIRRLINDAPPHLEPEGWLLIEHGFEQGSAVRQLFQQAGYRAITTHQDLAKRDRLTQGQRPEDDVS